jgi:hypothetical protein
MLSKRPVIVCGRHHLSWSQFTFSLIFLASICRLLALENELTWPLVTWLKLIVTKQNIMAPTRELEATNIAILSRYDRFLQSVMMKFHGVCQIVKMLLVFNYICWWLLLMILPYFTGLITAFSIIATAPLAMIIPYLFLNVPVYRHLDKVLWLRKLIQRKSTLLFYTELPPFSTQAHALDDMVTAMSTRQAKDPKDRAFGIQPILEFTSKQSFSVSDYSQSLEEVYKRFTVDFVRNTKQVSLLIVSSLTHQDGRTSWVADWQMDLTSQMFWLNQDRRLAIFKVNGTSTTTPSSSWPWTANTENWTLKIRGHKVCEVMSFHPMAQTSESYHESEYPLHLQNLGLISDLRSYKAGRELVRYLVHRQHHFHQAKGASQDALNAYFEALCFRWITWFHHPPTVVFSVLSRWHRRKNWFHRTYQDILLVKETGNALLAHIWMCNSFNGSGRQIFQAKMFPSLELAQRQKKLKINGREAKPEDKDGTVRTVGICTNAVAVGDIVVAIEGLERSLMVIRPFGSGYRLVSPAIVFSRAEDELKGAMIQLAGEMEEYVIY